MYKPPKRCDRMDKDILLLYNPKAGDTFFRFELERFLNVFGNMGCTVRIFRSQVVGDMAACIQRTNMEELGLIITAGGDGTINEVLQALMKSPIRVPLGVIPAGTSNDVAHYLGMPEDYSQCIDVLLRMHMETMNVGEVNGTFFLNRCGFGNMVNIFQATNQDIKNTFGKVAYYMTGLAQLPKLESFPLKIQAGEQIYEDEFVMFLIHNGEGANIQNRSFQVDSPQSDTLEFVGIKNSKRFVNQRLLLRSIQRVPKNPKYVLRIRGDEFYITSSQIPNRMQNSYVDGECGPGMPLHFRLHRKALQIITNRECSTWNNEKKQIEMFHVEH